MKPTLYLMVGYPGSGKTTAAKYIHELTGAVHLWADHERNQMFKTPTHDHEENIQLYTALNNKVRDLLRQGESVVFDTNFNFYKDRKRLKVMAAKEGADTKIIWITTPLHVAKERATEKSHGQQTRIWGNMPVERFDRIAGNLQPPDESEQPIKLDGQSFSKEDIAKALNPA